MEHLFYQGQTSPYGRSRRHHYLLTAACLIAMLDDDNEAGMLCGRLLGSKNIKHTRKRVEEMMLELGSCAKRAYKSSLETFNKLHDDIMPAMSSEFRKTSTGGGRPNGNVPPKLHLSAAIRYFSGDSVYDIMLMHGMGRQIVYDSVHGVVNVINNTNTLSFNVSFEFTFFSFLL